MGTAQLLLLTLGLSLLTVELVKPPPLTPAQTEELLGDWYIIRWAGDIPIPDPKKRSPLPPFTFVIGKLKRLEFRMNIMKPIGCVQFKLPLTGGSGLFFNWWYHRIHINFLPGKKNAIAFFKATTEWPFYQVMMLMGRALDVEPKFVTMFEDFVVSKGLNMTHLINPPHVDACKLAEES